MTITEQDKGEKAAQVADTDSLDTLSLSNIPLESRTLKNARLVKDSRMKTSVELYNDPIAGSLLIEPEDIASQLSASPNDQKVIEQLSSLNSYDVYSLRRSFRRLGIAVEDEGMLEISDDMKSRLSSTALEFTRPLLQRIFGGNGVDLNDPEALQKIFKDPDVKRVKANLLRVSQATGISIEEIPNFLQEYNEVFLSVAYYKYSFDNIGREIDRFLVWIKELQSHRDVSSSKQTSVSCAQAAQFMSFLITSIRERLIMFQARFEEFWDNISQDSFVKLRTQIDKNHDNMGAILCGLSVKIENWANVFPDNQVGGPQGRAKYVMTDVLPGLENLKEIEVVARSRLGMPEIK